MADNPNVGPDPVDAKPNHVREKTYEAPNAPERVTAERQKLPEHEAESKVREDMPKAVDAVLRKT